MDGAQRGPGGLHSGTTPLGLLIMRRDLWELFRQVDVDEEREREVATARGNHVVNRQLRSPPDIALPGHPHGKLLIYRGRIGEPDDEFFHTP